MRDPVIASDGEHYEREYIEKHLEKFDFSPKQGAQIKIEKKVYPDTSLKNKINDFLLQHPELFTTDDVYITRHNWDEIIKAVQTDNVSRFKDFVILDPRLSTLAPQDSQTLNKAGLPSISMRQMAINCSAYKIMKQLGIQFSAEEKEWDATTKLYDAFRKGDLQTIKTLHEAGYNIQKLLKVIYDSHFEPLHHLIIANNYLDVAEFFLKEKIIDLKTISTPYCPVHVLASRNQVQVLKLLEQYGLSIHQTNPDGITTLHAAVRTRAIDSLIFLAEHKADVNAKDNNGRTPLHYVHADFRHPQEELQMATILLQHNANPNVASHDGMTPLHTISNPLTAELLLKNKAEVDVKDLNGNTPLNTIAGCEPLDEKEKVKIINLLLKQGANPNGGNPSYDRSALLGAVCSGRDEVSLALMQGGANVFVVRKSWNGDGKYETLLGMWGAKSQDDRVCKALIERRCDKWTKAFAEEAPYTAEGYAKLEKLQLPIVKITSDDALRLAKHYLVSPSSLSQAATLFSAREEHKETPTQSRESLHSVTRGGKPYLA